MPRRCWRPGYGGFWACGGSVNFGHYRKKHRTREMFWKSSEARLFLGKNQRIGPFLGRNRLPGLNKTISRAFRHTLRRRSMASKTEGRGIWPTFSTRNKVQSPCGNAGGAAPFQNAAACQRAGPGFFGRVVCGNFRPVARICGGGETEMGNRNPPAE